MACVAVSQTGLLSMVSESDCQRQMTRNGGQGYLQLALDLLQQLSWEVQHGEVC